MHIVHYNQVHNGSARSHQLAAFREDSGYLSVFGSYELGVHQKGGYFIDSAAGGVYKAAGSSAVFTLRTVHCHLVLLVRSSFGGLCGFVHGFHFVLSLLGDDAVFVKG